MSAAGMRTLMKRLVAVLVAVVTLTNGAWAAATAGSAVPTIGMREVITVVFGLLFVLGIIFACAWLMRRFNGGSAVNGRAIKILAVTPLGAKEKLVLVSVGQQQLLLGVTAQQISTLHELTEPLSLTAHPEGSPFARQLGALIGGNKASHVPDNSTPQ